MAALDGPRDMPPHGGPPRQLVILLHGYGSNGEDLIGLAPYWRQALPDAVFVSPNAPEPCPGAPDGYQWWPLASLDSGSRAAGVRSAAPVVDAFIDAELARYGLTEDRLVLGGFSQGAMMTLHVGPRRERQLAGLMAYSGMLGDPATMLAEVRSKPPVLLVHGDADPMVPIAGFHKAQAALAEHGFDLTTHVSRGLGHSIDLDGLNVGAAFLTRVLA